MLLINDIRLSFEQQQLLTGLKSLTVNRERLSAFPKSGKHVEVISGIRRCGKSTLMQQIQKKIKGKSVFFNFEDARIHAFEASDFPKLDEVMGKGVKSYFFDEIQNVEGWEVFVRQLHDRGEKVYLTGSNANLLSRELGTRLTGRHLRYELFPFSYAEYLTFKKSTASAASLRSYLQKGGFPEYLESENTDILQNLVRDIVMCDIAVRYNIRNSGTLIDMTLFLLSSVGKEHSYNSVRKAFKIGSPTTVSDYIYWLEECYLMFFVQRFSWSARSSAVNPRKVYGIDTGLINANSLSYSDDRGRLLENAVYLHLRRKSHTVYYFREDRECDFVVMEKKKCLMALQVCESLTTDNLGRETEGLLGAMDFFKLSEGTIVTLDQRDELKVRGKRIRVVPGWEFLNL